MYTLSENCPRRDVSVHNGSGLIHIKDLTDKEGLYGHGRMFAHVTVDPGCSIGYHATASTTAWKTAPMNRWNSSPSSSASNSRKKRTAVPFFFLRP